MQAACDQQHDQAQGKPGKRKQRADLSHYIARLIRIVPDMPFEPYIHYDAYKKFEHCKDAGSRRGFHQRGRSVVLFEIVIECQQTGSPGQRHRPVSVPSEHIFNYRIPCGSRKKHYNTHTYSICRPRGCSHVIFMKIAAFCMPRGSNRPVFPARLRNTQNAGTLCVCLFLRIIFIVRIPGTQDHPLDPMV